MKRFEVGMMLYKTAYVKGHFITKAGKEVNHHFEKLLFVTDATIVKELTPLMSELIPEDTEILIGHSFGGVILASSVGTNMERNFSIMRKGNQEEKVMFEGSQIAGKRVCLVTDVVSSAETVMEFVDAIKAKGANIDTVVCAVRRSSEAQGQLSEVGITLKHVFTMNYLKQLMED